jgi:undecaprenyl-diphosphatase
MAALAVTFLGSGWMMLGLVPGLLSRRWQAPSTAVTLLLAVTAGAVAAIKPLVGRVRPCQSLSFAHALPIDCPTDSSFPSGHAAGSFAFACFVLGMNRRAGAPLVLLAGFVALSRVVLGLHYLSDVMGGAALGALLGWAAARLYRERRHAPPD